MATTIIRDLRVAGQRVYLVGPTTRASKGRHGVAIQPDLTLSQAMRRCSQVQGLIIPASEVAVKQLAHDPRVLALIAHTPTAPLLVLEGCELAGALGAEVHVEARVRWISPSCPIETFDFLYTTAS